MKKTLDYMMIYNCCKKTTTLYYTKVVINKYVFVLFGFSLSLRINLFCLYFFHNTALETLWGVSFFFLFFFFLFHRHDDTKMTGFNVLRSKASTGQQRSDGPCR